MLRMYYALHSYFAIKYSNNENTRHVYFQTLSRGKTINGLNLNWIILKRGQRRVD